MINNAAKLIVTCLTLFAFNAQLSTSNNSNGKNQHLLHQQLISSQQSFNPCQSSPSSTRCLNGGSCVVRYREYELPTFDCICPIGFEASLCEIASPSICRDDNPCANGATCQLTTSLNDYKCICPEGFRGKNCEQIDHCRANSCANGAKCISNEHSFTCNCTQGFTGETCEKDIDECAIGIFHEDNSIFDHQHPHINQQQSLQQQQQRHGNGRHMKLQHIIQLGANESSPLATIDYASSASSNRVGVCGQHGRCSNTIGSFVCTCDAGWTGKRCDRRYVPCNPSPCLNGGSCSQDLTKLIYKCQCPPGFTGTNCEINIDDCGEHSVCQNGGTCIDGINNYTCACPPQWTGPFCGQDVDECVLRPHVCHNGATCINKEGGYQCSCVNGWTGHDCSENIDDCSNAACGNGATCHDRVGSFICECPTGKTGLLCHLDDLCESIPPPCHPNAICDSSGVDGSPKCFCPPGFTGDDCSVDVDECANINITGSPCEHGGTCVNTPGSFRCECPRGFSGHRCEININECENNPCRNHGTCLDEEGGYRCVCMPGFTGTQCEHDVNECASSPCKNGGKCIDHINSFKCDCGFGHYGDLCQFSKICANNQHCVERYADGTCNPECNKAECLYDGLDCERNQDQYTENKARGVLVLKLKPSLDSYDKEIAKIEIANILRLLYENFGGTIFKVVSEATVDQGQWTELELTADTRRCHSHCYETVDQMVDHLNNNNITLAEKITDIRLKTEPTMNSQVFCLCLIVLTAISTILMVLSRGNNKQKIKAKATTWFPEGFFETSKGVRKDPTVHVKSGNMSVSTLQAISGNFLRGGKRNEKRISTNPKMINSTDIDRHGINTPSGGGGIYHEPYDQDWPYESCNGTDSGSMINHNNEPMTPPTMQLDPVNIEGPHGHTPLMVASMRPDFPKEPIGLVKYGTTSEVNGQSTVVDLLQKGAQVNISSKVTGETALHLSARFGRADHTRQLLERGADPNAQDATGRTPIHAAIAAESRGVFELLAQHRSIDINSQTNDGTTPLILAAKVGSGYMIDKLISFECDVNKSDANGKTALHWAAATNNVYGIKKLLANGANKDSQDSIEKTPLYLAAREGCKGSVEILLSHNANKDISNNMDISPIDIARTRQHFDIVRLLEDHEPSTPKSVNSVLKSPASTSITSPPNTVFFHMNSPTKQTTTEVYHVPCLKNFILTPSPESPFSTESLSSPPGTYYQQYRNPTPLSSQKPAGVFI